MSLCIEKKYQRGLDTMFLVYSSLQEHPASAICEQFILSKEGWVSTPLLLVEFYTVLTRNYGVDRQSTIQKTMELVDKPIEILSLEGHTVAAAIRLANEYNLDTNDAILLQLCLTSSINVIATDDRRFAHACDDLGITVENPITAVVRQQMAVWEEANLPPRGLPRLLLHIHRWLEVQNLNIAELFYEATGQYLRLP